MGRYRLISLNIDGRRRLDRVLPFLQVQKADILCLQEVHFETYEQVKHMFGYEGCFAPMVGGSERTPSLPQADWWGLAILSRLPLQQAVVQEYEAYTEDYPRFFGTRPERPRATLLVAELVAAEEVYRIGTTHFTWTPAGEVSEEQRTNLQHLLAILAQYPDLVLCGDFNAPRGGEIYTGLAAVLHDNLPESVRSTIDPHLHGAGPLPLVVDSIFSSPEYRVTEVQVHTGVSDHCALSASIGRL